jgi:hypothetical protein
MFYAKSFTYNGIPSELFNIQVASIDSGDSAVNGPGSGTIEIIENYVYRRPVPYFYGVKFTSKVSFPISFFSPDEIDAQTFSYLQNWLFGQLNYKNFVLIQPDMDSFYINAIFTEPNVIRAGNIIYGLQGTCIMDSQFAWTYPKTSIYNYTSAPSASSLILNNDSHYAGYLYPQMTFTVNSAGSSLSIINTSDNNREFLFSGLSPNEVITINNDLGIVTSSLLIPRLSIFNKKFLRFVPGINILSITGGISQLTLTTQFARRLGG